MRYVADINMLLTDGQTNGVRQRPFIQIPIRSAEDLKKAVSSIQGLSVLWLDWFTDSVSSHAYQGYWEVSKQQNVFVLCCLVWFIYWLIDWFIY